MLSAAVIIPIVIVCSLIVTWIVFYYCRGGCWLHRIFNLLYSRRRYQANVPIRNESILDEIELNTMRNTQILPSLTESNDMKQVNNPTPYSTEIAKRILTAGKQHNLVLAMSPTKISSQARQCNALNSSIKPNHCNDSRPPVIAVPTIRVAQLLATGIQDPENMDIRSKFSSLGTSCTTLESTAKTTQDYTSDCIEENNEKMIISLNPVLPQQTYWAKKQLPFIAPGDATASVSAVDIGEKSASLWSAEVQEQEKCQRIHRKLWTSPRNYNPNSKFSPTKRSTSSRREYSYLFQKLYSPNNFRIQLSDRMSANEKYQQLDDGANATAMFDISSPSRPQQKTQASKIRNDGISEKMTCRGEIFNTRTNMELCFDENVALMDPIRHQLKDVEDATQDAEYRSSHDCATNCIKETPTGTNETTNNSTSFSFFV